MSTATLASESVQNDNSPIPEFGMTKDRARYCQFKVTPPSVAPATGRERLFEFMDSANKLRNGRQKKFVIVGTDYLTGGSFHFISFCEDAASTIHFISDYFKNKENWHCKSQCTKREVIISADAKPDYGIPIAEYTFLSQVKEFLHYRPKALLRECVIKITAPPNLATKFGGLIFHAAVVTYRLPVMDVVGADPGLYILFSRQCSMKRQLYNVIVEALKRQGVTLPSNSSVDFNPDIADYLFSETGKRTL